MLDLQLGTALDASAAGKLIMGGWYSHPKLKDVGMAVIDRHSRKCQGCGFVSRSSSQVKHGWMVPVDTTHPALFALDEMAATCLCPICACVLATNWSVTAKTTGSKIQQSPGMFIYLPHISQLELNRIAIYVISIMCSRKVNSQTKLESIAINIDNVMCAQNKELQGTMPMYRDGKDSEFARALSLLPVEYYEERSEIVGMMRWWPNVSFWREQGVYWMKASVDSMLVKNAALSEVLNEGNA